jgi:hypothetical protein
LTGVVTCVDLRARSRYSFRAEYGDLCRASRRTAQPSQTAQPGQTAQPALHMWPCLGGESGAPAFPCGQLSLDSRAGGAESRLVVAEDDQAAGWRLAEGNGPGRRDLRRERRWEVEYPLCSVFVREAVAASATRWSDRDAFPHDPFMLDEDSRHQPSEFLLDVVIDGVRYEYGFSADSQAIRSEHLYAYPQGKRRRLFERWSSEREAYAKLFLKKYKPMAA